MRPPSIDGDKLRALREVRGWTQRELGDMVGADAQTVRAWEKNRFSPQRLTQKALAEALQVPPEAFLSPITTASEATSALRTCAAHPGDPDQPPLDASATLPNPRHSGIHELLALYQGGQQHAALGALSAVEEEGLRSHGRSGPAVATLAEAVELVMRWRDNGTTERPMSEGAKAEVGRLLGSIGHDGLPMPPEAAGPERGFVELVQNEALRDSLGITPMDERILLEFRMGGTVDSLSEAVSVWTAIRRRIEARKAALAAMRAGDEDEA